MNYEDGQWYWMDGEWWSWSRVSTSIWRMNEIDKLLKQVEFV